MIVFRGLRVGSVAPAMWGHRQAAVTPSGGREQRPFGRPCGPLRSRRAVLVMRPASRPTTLLAEQPARPSDVSPSYEGEYYGVDQPASLSTRTSLTTAPLIRCLPAFSKFTVMR